MVYKELNCHFKRNARHSKRCRVGPLVFGLACVCDESALHWNKWVFFSILGVSIEQFLEYPTKMVFPTVSNISENVPNIPENASNIPEKAPNIPERASNKYATKIYRISSGITQIISNFPVFHKKIQFELEIMPKNHHYDQFAGYCRITLWLSIAKQTN